MTRRGRGAAAAAAVGVVLLVAGCGGGGGDSAQTAASATVPPAAAAPIAVAQVSPGGRVRAGASTPEPVATALAGSNVVVVAFLVPNAADDESVAAALRAVRGDARYRAGVSYFVYPVGKAQFGDLADLLGVSGTPAVAVIGRDRTLTNLWMGLVDADILRQSISDARESAAANPAAAVASGG